MASARLSPETARAFLAGLGAHIERNINIMDREGIIIASRDSARLGAYHEAAHRLVLSKGDIETVPPAERLPQGVRPGVNLPIRVGGEILGVVGVTGDPAEVRDLAYAVKTGVETMAELERVKDGVLRKQSGRTLLVQRLIRRDQEFPFPAADLARKLGYDGDIPRSPVLIVGPADFDPEELWRDLKARLIRGAQDFGAPDGEGRLLVFRTLPQRPLPGLADQERELEDFSRRVQALRPGLACFAGMAQGDLGRYGLSYRQARWLGTRYGASGPFRHIRRHILEYLVAQVPRSELVGLFEDLRGHIEGSLDPGAADTVGALGERDFNLKEAARDLCIHRNTLSARLDRIAAAFGADPRSDGSARELYRAYALYRSIAVHDAQ